MDVKLTEAQKIKILNSDDIYVIMQQVLLRENKIDLNREHFWVIGLANNNMVLFIELISLGTVNKTLVHPMEVFSFALQKRAVKIILCHNHPSGELRPSEADNDITDRLIQVGLIIETEVIDHLIISEKSYLSFADVGLMDELRNSTKYVPRYKLEEQIRKEAKEIGVTAGLKTGQIASRKEMAIKCLEEGLEPQYIAKLTGLTVKVIENLKNKLN
ncbi:JAB domain-containing protein [Flavobacterium cerinum]|uniref:JAB domain-containing protein n=1 Tax=Flavobacterium cerinum TaxID=2502784 RepID=A0ABY5IS81_9FLAO|nr:JAB domain-containing protein [Flavobacterium cerinum]UUC45146.1 JAB domain-containing protein [Flavobacterium cerinum]